MVYESVQLNRRGFAKRTVLELTLSVVSHETIASKCLIIGMTKQRGENNTESFRDKANSISAGKLRTCLDKIARRNDINIVREVRWGCN